MYKFYEINYFWFIAFMSIKNNEFLNESSDLNPVSLYAKKRIFSESHLKALNYVR